MALTAKLYQDDRAAERKDVDLDATVRGADRQPIDVSIYNLSAAGFRMAVPIMLPEQILISVGLAGIGIRDARVVRKEGAQYGCEFLVPLNSAEFTSALETETILRPLFPGEFPPAASQASPALVQDSGKLPIRVRVLVIGSLALSSWAISIGVAWLILG